MIEVYGKKTKAQVLQRLNEFLTHNQQWMDKYNNMEETPEDGEEYITEGRIEALEGAITLVNLMEDL
jgi:hypothetical protein|tara:strand:+ start:351 stop:551 length:201 start_codon:yes stop_codon:yes gene_type:complete